MPELKQLQLPTTYAIPQIGEGKGTFAELLREKITVSSPQAGLLG
jgi:hypothetical protein